MDFNIKKGDCAQSIRGRDKGSIYIVADKLPNGKLMLVDGKIRTLAKPKQKNIKHCKHVDIKNNISEKFANNQKVFDFEIITVLKEFKPKIDKEEQNVKR